MKVYILSIFYNYVIFILKSYLRGISRFTAILGLAYNLLTISRNIDFTIRVLPMVFWMIYPMLAIIKVVYDQFHPFFVNKLNKMLEKTLNHAWS